MSSTTPGTSGTGKRHRGTAKRRRYTISISSSSTSDGHRDSKRRKSKRKHLSSSSDTSSSRHGLEKDRSAKKQRDWRSDSSRSSGKKKSKKRRREKSSSSESTPKRQTKRKTKAKAKTVSESSGDTSSRGNNALQKGRTKTVRHSSVNPPKARKTSDYRDRDTANDLQPPSAAIVNAEVSQQRAAKMPCLRSNLSAQEHSGEEALSEGTTVYSRTTAEKTLRSDEQNGVKNNMFRLAADQDQEGASTEDSSKKKKKLKSEADDNSVTEAGQMTDGGASEDTCESVYSSECELEGNQAESVEGATEDQDLPPMEGQPPSPADPDLAAVLADLLFDIFFALLWQLIQKFGQPQHA